MSHVCPSRRCTLAGLVIHGVFPILFATSSLWAQPQRQVSRSTSVNANGKVVTHIGPAGASGPAYHPSRVLVRFRRAPAFLAGSRAAHGFAGDPNLFVIDNPPGLSVTEVLRRYRVMPGVVYAEPDYVVKVINTPTDPMWNQQWDMVQIAAPAAWDTQTSAN